MMEKHFLAVDLCIGERGVPGMTYMISLTSIRLPSTYINYLHIHINTVRLLIHNSHERLLFYLSLFFFSSFLLLYQTPSCIIPLHSSTYI